jgi:hypothetical protein
MKKSLLTIAAILLGCALIATISTAIEPTAEPEHYGFGVEVTPDREFDDFVQCALNVYRLDDEQGGMGPIPLRLLKGTANSMLLTTEDGTEYEFTCFVGDDKAHVTYEIEGRRSGERVMSQMGSVRFK